MKLLSSKIQTINGKKIILWIVMAIILFKIRILGMDLSKYIFILMILFLLLHFRDVKMIFNKIGSSHYKWFLILGIIWVSGLLFREFFYTFNTNSSYILSKELIVIYIYILVVPLFSIVAFHSIENFEHTISSVVVTQSIIIIGSLFFKPIKYLLSMYYFYDKEYLFYISSGVKGVGFGVIGAAGSIVLFSSQVLLVYMMLKGKIEVKNFLFKYLIIMVAEAVSGRSGFYCSIALFAFWIITEKRGNVLSELRRITPKVLIFMSSAFVILYLLDPELVTRIFKRSLELFYGLFDKDGGSLTFSELSKMDKPALTLETLFGTSVTRGISSFGTVFQNDSGYWQKFFSLGLIGSIAYYCGFLLLYLIPLFKNKIKNKIYFLIVLLIMFIIEIKEPFFSYLILPMIFISIMSWDILNSE